MTNLNCVICIESFGQSDEVRATTCGHMFHHSCLTKWFRVSNNRTCPHCRATLTHRKIFRIYLNINDVDTSAIEEKLRLCNAELQRKDKLVADMRLHLEQLEMSKNLIVQTIGNLNKDLESKTFELNTYLKIVEEFKKENNKMNQSNEKFSEEIKQLQLDNAHLKEMARKLVSSMKTESDPKKRQELVDRVREKLCNGGEKNIDVIISLKREREEPMIGEKSIERVKNFNAKYNATSAAKKKKPRLETSSSNDVSCVIELDSESDNDVEFIPESRSIVKPSPLPQLNQSSTKEKTNSTDSCEESPSTR